MRFTYNVPNFNKASNLLNSILLNPHTTIKTKFHFTRSFTDPLFLTHELSGFTRVNSNREDVNYNAYLLTLQDSDST